MEVMPTQVATLEMKEKYTKILRDNGIENEVEEVIFIDPQFKGENMATKVEYVKIKFADNTEDLELFIKKPMNNEMHAKWVSDMGLFEKESTFFNLLLPDARKFCEDKTGNSDLLNFFPKSYYGDDTLIVLENLAVRDYFMLNKEDRQDFDQAKMVLENMARYHGVFYAFINQMGLEKFKEKYPHAAKEALYRPELNDMMGPAFENNILTSIRIIKASNLEGMDDAVEWLGQFLGNTTLYSLLCDSILDQPDDIFRVLNHGDCWNNNMMFTKDKSTNVIKDHIFIDMQVLRYGSPNLDIGHFLFSSVKPEVRRQRLTDLLKAHFVVFKETVKKLDSPITVTFDEFVNDYKKKCTIGFFIGITFLCAIGALKEINMEDAVGMDMDQMMEHFNNAMKKWFDENPEKGVEAAQAIINQIVEYRALTNK